MRIIFKVIRWKNFLSTGDVFTEIKLDEHNTTLIIGTNGVGKSTMLDALSFSLYGKPFRNINKPQLVNSINNKNMVVELEFIINDKEYKVIRGIKPDVFEIYEDGIFKDQQGLLKDQEILDSIIKINFKSFKQIIVLGSTNFTPFMQLPAGDRKIVIEDLLDQQIFATMIKISKKKKDDNKALIQKIENDISVARTKIEVHKNNIHRINKQKTEQHNDNKDVINSCDLDIICQLKIIDDSNEKILLLNGELEKARIKSKKVNKLIDIKESLCDASAILKKELNFYSKNDNCPVCKQGIDYNFKTQTTDIKKEKLESTNKKIQEIDVVYEKLVSSFRKIDDIKNDIRTTEDNIKQAKWDIESSTKIKQSVIETLEKLENDKFDHERISEFNNEIDSLLNQKEKTLLERQEIDVLMNIIDNFKLHMTKKYIKLINKFVNKHLSSMNFFVNFELNEAFEEKIKSRHRDVFSYDSFSEGEKSRIDLALLFTWRAISKLRNKSSTNILILDEVFDGSLDSSGTDDLMNIMKDIVNDTNIFVISHKTDALLDKFDNIIRFEKSKNFSRIAS